MSVLGDIARKATRRRKPLVKVTPEVIDQLTNTDDGADGHLAYVLEDCCTALLEAGMAGLRRYHYQAKQDFAVAQQRAHGGAWKRHA